MDFRSLVVGVDTRVPLINGRWVTAVNFDNAATTPPLVSVLREVVNFAPWYSSVHRGTGYKSQLSSKIYDESRSYVLDFVHGDHDADTVIYVKNTTEAINKLANRLCSGHRNCVVLSTDMEHHSNDLPWRKKFELDYVHLDSLGRLSLESLEEKLRRHRGAVRLVSLSGASNVTGHINPIYEAAKLAHRYGARILVDGAQLVPHSIMDMKPKNSPEHIDFLAFSAHKMYAPFGTGVLIGPCEYFECGDPDYSGGGTVKLVTHNYVVWDAPPHKEEAGTQNLIGIVALLAAMRELMRIGLEKIEEHERELLKYALEGLKNIDGVELYGDIENLQERVAIVPFNIEGIHHEKVARALSCEAGIAVRNGCFCAQPYVQRILNVSKSEIEKIKENEKLKKPGMIRVSFGFYNSFAEIDRLLRAVRHIAKHREYYNEKYEGEDNKFKLV